jgi:hypothetical protein
MRTGVPPTLMISNLAFDGAALAALPGSGLRHSIDAGLGMRDPGRGGNVACRYRRADAETATRATPNPRKKVIDPHDSDLHSSMAAATGMTVLRIRCVKTIVK